MLLVICPIGPEVKSLTQFFTNQGFTHQDELVGKIKTKVFEQINIRLAIGGLGKVQFGLQTLHLLQNFPQTTSVICAGSAGAIQGHLRPADVVVGESCVEHDFKERFVSRPLPSFKGAATLIEDLRPVSFSDFSIHFGTIASGDEDIIEDERAKELVKLTGGLAVAWEGAGGARACKFLNVPFLELRGISDMANPTTPQDFLQNLNGAMANVAKLLLKLSVKR